MKKSLDNTAGNNNSGHLPQPDHPCRMLDENGKELKSSSMLFDNRIWSEWLSTKEAAAYLSITPNALRIMVCRSKIRTYRLGRCLRFKLSDLKDLLLGKGEIL